VGPAWGWTPLVGLALGLGWLLFHQAFVRLGGPFVGATGVLLVHVALTGGHPLRGLAALADELTTDPEDTRRGLPDATGAATAVVTLVLLAMSSFLILLDVAPAALILVPLSGRATQALLLADADTDVGPAPPSTGQRITILFGTILAMGASPLMSMLVRPVRRNAPVAGLDYVILGLVALAVSLLVGALCRSWLRARFGSTDANAWHAMGAIAELTALAVLATRII
jgi:cobalamin synthase